MNDDAARVRFEAMFPEVNALPGAERELLVCNGDAEVHRSQRGANVSGHIVLAFAGVAEDRVAVGNKAGKKAFEITAHFRVGIFLDQQRGGSVLKMKRDQPNLEFLVGDKLRNLFGEFVKAAPTGFNFYFVNRLAEHKTKFYLRTFGDSPPVADEAEVDS